MLLYNNRMSNQVYASQEDPLFLSTRGNDKILFNKQENPPLAFLDKGILYEMDDGVLYFNGTPLSGGGGSGDVVGPDGVQDNSLAIFDGTTGKLLKGNSGMINNSLNGRFNLKQVTPGGDLNVVSCDYTTQSVNLGLYAGPQGSTRAFDSTCVGWNAGWGLNDNNTEETYVGSFSGTASTTGYQNVGVGSYTLRNADDHNSCVALGSYSCFQNTNGNMNTAVGAGSNMSNQIGSNNTACGFYSLQSNLGNYNTATGYYSQVNTINNTPGQIPNQSYGANSMKNLTTTCAGNNSFGWRALEGGSAATGVNYNNMFGDYNGLSANSGFEYNCCFGNSCLNSCATGKGNLCLGNSSGESFITGTESFNICVGNGTGKNNDNKVIRIGADGDNLAFGIAKPTDCYIQGIHNRDSGTSTARKLVSVDANGKLYGMTLGRANPYVNGWFQNYTTLHIVPTTTSNLAVLVDPTLALLTPGTYFNQPSAGTITYLGTDTVDIKVTVQISYRITGGANQIFDFIMYRSGSPVNGSTLRDHADNAAQFHSATLSCVIGSVSTNTNLQIYAANIGGTEALAIGNINVTYEVKY